MNWKDWWRERQDLYQGDELENVIVLGLSLFTGCIIVAVGWLLYTILK